jgi:tetratricopeptide (TPR) repeat protein
MVHVLLATVQNDFRLFSALTEVAVTALSHKQENIPNYMFSTMHIRDFFNEQLLIGPLGLFLFLPAAITVLLKRTRKSSTSIFLIVAGATFAGASVVAGDSNLGYARNWDLLAPGGIAMTTAGLGLFLATEKRHRAAMPALVCAVLVSLYHTTPWVLTNASAARSLERLKTLPLGLGRTEVVVAQWYRREGNSDQQREWLEKAVQEYPYNNNAHFLLGMYFKDHNRADLAVGSFARALELRPDKLLFRRHLVQVLMAVERNEEALTQLQWLIEHEPNDGRQWILYADTLRKLGRLEEARTAYERAEPLYRRQWEEDRDGYRSNFIYGVLYVNLDDMEKAFHYFERAVRAQPRSEAALFYTGYSLRVLGRYAEAGRYFRKCLNVNPNHPRRQEMTQWIKDESQ